ncbi:mitochondrial RNA binding complex 1 subunit [Trypanosoma equiperdum]|uniref:RNA-editing substrate-binding complex 7 protein domain-containing protein n=2 Tax=Trypanozoon TaxID=39700 RepID=Q384B4_TRYB2|nr:hypothetical protein, conserved [Trypanosoma brucei brucei TREU927]8FNC_7 Chain 7, RxLR effector protein [Trypanosoma brucei]8FNF_7 Chain 7, RxLR effector protein [Trypanosoma brucei]8FNI_7 Chain 7, RNA-editing substrate-binding complex protein 7 (RESC7) [Trypanosoma brucei]8FNK_7 Chain 7, RNA-editing substrate-binding complex protein 7 (RESC7) [Trypanosoma brucei]SCU65610.1 mitochondrial RNA binding complex 1 subunit [Trypanosoma equiperdum]EAN79867.1 hypothetical protein, conserved [Tryp
MRSSRGILFLSGAFAIRGMSAYHSYQRLDTVSHTSKVYSLQMQRQTVHFTPITRLGVEATANPTTATNATGQTGDGDGATALDVAMRVNKLKRLHQTGGGPSGKKQVELDAWRDLNNLTEAQINSAEGKAVSLLLNSWAYFAKYWEKGAEGPSASLSEVTPSNDSSSAGEHGTQ